MAREEIYNGAIIRSHPNINSNTGNFSVSGIIELHSGSYVDVVLIQALNIPNEQWQHSSEEEADDIYIRYAKLFLDKK